MKNVKYLLLIIGLFVVGIVHAENITTDRLLEVIKENTGSEVQLVNNEIAVTINGTLKTYTYDPEDNCFVYTLTESDPTDVKEVFDNQSMLHWIAMSSSNYEEYSNLKSQNTGVTVSYGNGCDMDAMGVCYDVENKTMKMSLSDTFTTYLISQYSVAEHHSEDPMASEIPAESPIEQPAGSPVEQPTETPVGESTTGDAKNPTTGSFAEYGIIIGLVVLLLVVILLKKRSETEYTL